MLALAGWLRATTWCLAMAPSTAHAADAADTPVSATQPTLLEPEGRRLRGNQVGMDAFGGTLGGRSVGQTFLVGGRATYYPIRQLGIAAMYGYSLGIGGLAGVRGHSIHVAHGQLEVPLIAAMRMGKSNVEMDLFGEAGAGAMYLSRTWQALGVVGGGVRIYLPVTWLALRIDALTFLHRTPRHPGSRLDTDVAFTLGLYVLLPQRGAPRRRRR